MISEEELRLSRLFGFCLLNVMATAFSLGLLFALVWFVLRGQSDLYLPAFIRPLWTDVGSAFLPTAFGHLVSVIGIYWPFKKLIQSNLPGFAKSELLRLWHWLIMQLMIIIGALIFFLIYYAAVFIWTDATQTVFLEKFADDFFRRLFFPCLFISAFSVLTSAIVGAAFNWYRDSYWQTEEEV